MRIYFENEDEVKEVLEYIYTERDGTINVPQTIYLFKEKGLLKLETVEEADILYKAFANSDYPTVEPEILKLIITQQNAIIHLKGEIKKITKSLTTARLY